MTSKDLTTNACSEDCFFNLPDCGPDRLGRRMRRPGECDMKIVERSVSAGGRPVFDLDEFLSRPLYAHLAHSSEHGPRESPVWFHWDGQAIWIIGGTSFP